MFKLMCAVICTQRFNWGELIFDKVRDSLENPSFGRILSLYLSEVAGCNIKRTSGTPLHHTKLLDMRMFERWGRSISKPSKKEVGESSGTQRIVEEEAAAPAEAVEAEVTVVPALVDPPATVKGEDVPEEVVPSERISDVQGEAAPAVTEPPTEGEGAQEQESDSKEGQDSLTMPDPAITAKILPSEKGYVKNRKELRFDSPEEVLPGDKGYLGKGKSI